MSGNGPYGSRKTTNPMDIITSDNYGNLFIDINCYGRHLI